MKKIKKLLLTSTLIGTFLLASTLTFSKNSATFTIQNESNYTVVLNTPNFSSNNYSFTSPKNTILPQSTVSNFQIIETNTSNTPEKFSLNFALQHSSLGKTFTTSTNQELQVLLNNGNLSKAFITETAQPQSYIPVKLTINGSNQLLNPVNNTFVLTLTTNSTFSNSSLF